MTNSKQTTQAEGIELLATDIMGWKKIKWVDQKYSGYSWVRKDEKEEFAFHARWSWFVEDWNPYKSEDDFRMVTDKLSDSQLMRMAWKLEFIDTPSVLTFARATLQERMDTVVKVLLHTLS